MTSKESTTARYVYVDNLAAITSLPGIAEVVQQRWVEAFDSCDLHSHISSISSTRMDSLGVELDLEGRCCRTTHNRLMGPRAGLRHALDRSKLSVWQLEALVGHCTCGGCDAVASVPSSAVTNSRHTAMIWKCLSGTNWSLSCSASGASCR